MYDEDDLDDPDSGALLPSSERGRSASRRITGKRGERATQRLFQLPIRHVGRVKLERVLDRNRMDARLSASEALVVNCPTASFLDTAPSTGKSGPPMRHLCPGDSGELQVAVTGLAPLELDYHRMVPPMPATSGRSKGSAKKESLKISHISSPRFSSPLLLQNGPSNLSPAERLALARQQQHDDDYRWAVAQKVDIPVTLDLSQPGLYHYLLDTVRDGCGNVLDISNAAADSKTSRSIIQSHEVAVHQRARATFVGCSADKPLPLLRGASGRNLSVRAADGDDEGGPWSVSVHFDPDASASRHYGTAAGKPWTREMSMPGTGTAKVRVEAPGIYTIESIKGKFCDGEVGAPWTCEVVDVPPPTADVKFSSIDDQCAGPVGVKALSVLTGTPPFRLHYQVTREGGRPVRRSREIRENTRDELEFRPDQDGVFEYRFLRLDDANYKDIKLDGPVLKQVVHPLASARFVAGAGHDGAKVVVHSCSGNSASADVEFTGSGPWSLTYSVSGSGVSSTHQVDKITTPRHTLDFKLPAHIAEHGGQLTVSLVSIKDGKGCERPLATSDMTIDVRRVTPTAGFIPAKGEREIAILEGGEAILPLRLSGDGPWRISYAHEDDRRPTETALNSANAQLSVNKKGRYTIVGIHDAHCPGEVLPAQAEYRVTWRPRPTLRIAEDAGMLAKNGQYVRPPVCVGTPDAFDFFMDGHFPLRVSYEHTTQVNGDRRRQREVFSAAQRLTPLQLSTLTAGVHTYELLEVADAVYPMTKLSGSSRMLEQTVHPLPSAMFVAPSKRPSFCLHDPLTPRKDMDHPTLLLTGAAPFTVHFALRDEDSRMVRTRTAEVRNREFAVDFPDFTFDAVGSWSITATRVIDANGCEFVPAAPPVVKVDVAETASIAPVGTRDDYCVGELVEFMYVVHLEFAAMCGPFCFAHTMMVGSFTACKALHHGR